MMKLRILRTLALILSFSLLYQLFFPTLAYALSGGPSQPEVHGFQSADSTQLVDPFTGDFSYNIPLFEIGGYPINLSYASGISMDQEASWVGLGWSLNPGAVTRTMRGIPDDFKSDEVRREINMKDNKTVGLKLRANVDLFSYSKDDNKKAIDTLFKASINGSIGGYYNTYNGYAMDFGAGLTPGFGGKSFGSVNIGYDPNQGLNFAPSLSYPRTVESTTRVAGLRGPFGTTKSTTVSNVTSLGTSFAFNSRSGFNGMSIGVSKRQDVTRRLRANYGKMLKAKKSSIGGSFGVNAPIPINTSTYTPRVGNSMITKSYMLSGTVGGELFGLNGNLTLSGYYNGQELIDRDVNQPAYGYLYAHDYGKRNDVMMDFNRENEQPFHPKMPYLPLANHTYDFFSVDAQGVGGSYRLHRMDVGNAFDPRAVNTTVYDNDFGVELGLGNAFKLGVTTNMSDMDSESRSWGADKGNAAYDKLDFKSSSNGFKHPGFFRRTGEMVPTDQTRFTALQGYEPVRIMDATTAPRLQKNDGSKHQINIPQDGGKDRRTQVFQALTAEQAAAYGTNLSLHSYDSIFQSVDGQELYNGWDKKGLYLDYFRVGSYHKPHHLSEISVLGTNGMKYVYGIPVYNISQRDVTFNVATTGSDKSIPNDMNANCATGLVTYDNQGDNSRGNQKGKDNFFQSSTIPAYAHSFLLTEVLSPDYVDRTGDGVTEDDIGKAVKLNYRKLRTDYQWRTPIDRNKGKYNPGFRSKANDDKANYSYGEKELWYLHTIESNTHVAEFYCSQRKDALPVLDENGGKDANATRMERLDRIEIYTKAERLRDPQGAKPIKVIEFGYDYELCPNVPNQETFGDGKLTLKSVSINMGDSKKGRFSPYKFSYGPNPGYNLQAYDRWGNYKPNDCNLPNADDPYVDQDQASADTYAASWNLDEITLPSGGQIKITYEADDYAYVQDKQAMQMFQVMGVGDGPSMYERSENKRGELYPKPLERGSDRHYLYVKLTRPVANSEELRKYYFDGINQIYTRLYVYLNGGSNPEYVSGYSAIENVGLVPDGNGEYAWIRLKPASLNSGFRTSEVSGLVKNAFLFFTANLPEKITNPQDEPNGGIESMIMGIAGFFSELGRLATGTYGYMKQRHMCGRFEPSKSFVRLNSPYARKLGGGARVKNLSMSDNWSAMGGNYKSDYGQQYEYTTLDEAKGEYISSGVAAYEPALGGDENPFKVPVGYSQKKLLLPDDELYMEQPIGESLFPSPVVGYSRVKISSYSENEPADGFKNGFSVKEFFTAKDFPVKTSMTEIDKEIGRKNFLGSIVNFNPDESVTVSQGYAIELNDMHGKPRSEFSYSDRQPKRPISGVEYFYHVDPEDGKRLLNEVDVLDYETGLVAQTTIGVEVDMVMDSKWEESTTAAFGIDFSTDGFVWPFPTVPISFPFFPANMRYENAKFQSIVLTKVIQRFGIPKMTKYYDAQSEVATEDLLRDKETGRVILTKTQNEHDDPIYNFTYPAFYSYDALGPASHNLGYTLKNKKAKSGTLEQSNASDHFNVGDKLWMVLKATNDTRLSGTQPYEQTKSAWVNKVATNSIHLIGSDGKPISGDIKSLTVVSSGKRNRLEESVGSITLKKNPVQSGSLVLDQEVLSAQAVEYSDRWGTFCEQKPHRVCGTDWAAAADLTKLLDTIIKAGSFSYPYDQQYSTSKHLNWTTLPGGNRFKQQVEAIHLAAGAAVSEDIDLCPEECITSVVAGYDSSLCLLGVMDTFPYRKIYDPNCTHRKIYEFQCSCPSNETRYNLLYWRDTAITDPFTAKLNFSWFGGSSNFGDKSTCFLNLETTDTFPADEDLLGVSEVRFISEEEENIDSFYNQYIEIDLVYNTGTGNDTITAQAFSPCFDVSSCWRECGLKVGQTVNPFLEGLRGQWRPKRQFAFHADRSSGLNADHSGKPNLKTDGTIEGFDPYWDPTNGSWEKSSNPGWVAASTATQYSPPGNALESKDALSRYSSEIYGYNRQLVIGVAQNARNRQIAFEGFEDWYWPFKGNCEPEAHWSMKELLDTVNIDTLTYGISSDAITGILTGSGLTDYYVSNPANYKVNWETQVITTDTQLIQIDQSLSHSGYASLKIKDTSMTRTTLVIDFDNIGSCGGLYPTYQIDTCDCLGRFSPDAGRKYIISAWAKETHYDDRVYSYENATIAISSSTKPISSFKPGGPVIDGWQRIYGVFYLPPGSSSLEVMLQSKGFEGYSNFDDIRIQPYNSTMKSFVYHTQLLKPMAELDENNYATFFEYDKTGNLIRVKKETERGIVTLEENRQGTHKNSN